MLQFNKTNSRSLQKTQFDLLHFELKVDEKINKKSANSRPFKELII